MIPKVKHHILKMVGYYSHFKAEVKCNHKWYGNTYGGFYICPELLNENSILYSFGIGEDMSFDNTIIKNHNCHVFGFDPTPKSINWVKNQRLNDNFHFYEFGINDKSGFIEFYLPKNSEHVSGSIITQKNIDVMKKVNVEMKSLADIMNELGHKHIDVLKMDIEGSEYDVIDNILDSKISITQILIEFHDRFFKNGKYKSKEVIKKMNRSGYKIFAISDSFEEVSFINKNAL